MVRCLPQMAARCPPPHDRLRELEQQPRGLATPATVIGAFEAHHVERGLKMIDRFETISQPLVVLARDEVPSLLERSR